MVKKQQKTAAPKPAKGRRKDAASASAKAADTPFAEQVKASAQQIWSAGLAAFAKAQDQGGAMLDKLSGDGAKAQDPMRGAGEKLDSAARRMSDLAGEVGSRAGQHWDKLESIFEERVANALKRLGVPTAKEVEALIARIDALSAAVGGSAAKPAARKAVAPARKPAAKAAAKPVAAKKPVAKKAAAAKPAAKKAAAPRKKAASAATAQT